MEYKDLQQPAPHFVFTNTEFIDMINRVANYPDRAQVEIFFTNASSTIRISVGKHYHKYVTVNVPKQVASVLNKALDEFQPVIDYMSGIFPRKGFPGFRELVCEECGHKVVEPCRDVGSPSTDPCPECGDRMVITAAIAGTELGPYILTV